jgi:hypothetical protein
MRGNAAPRCGVPGQPISGRGIKRRSSQPGLVATIRSPKGHRCTPQHFVLCGTYIPIGQEYPAIVTWHVNDACEWGTAT